MSWVPFRFRLRLRFKSVRRLARLATKCAATNLNGHIHCVRARRVLDTVRPPSPGPPNFEVVNEVFKTILGRSDYVLVLED